MLPGMPETQDMNGGFLNLVTKLVVTDENAPDFARLEMKQLFSQTRIRQQNCRCSDERLHCSGRGRLVDYRKKIVETCYV